MQPKDCGAAALILGGVSTDCPTMMSAANC